MFEVYIDGEDTGVMFDFSDVRISSAEMMKRMKDIMVKEYGYSSCSAYLYYIVD